MGQAFSAYTLQNIQSQVTDPKYADVLYAGRKFKLGRFSVYLAMVPFSS